MKRHEYVFSTKIYKGADNKNTFDTTLFLVYWLDWWRVKVDTWGKN